MQKSYLLATVILLIALLWVGSGLVFSGSDEKQTAEETTVSSDNGTMKVRVMDSQAVDHQKTVSVNGRTKPSKDVVLRAETEGQITDILVDEGVVVEAGTAIIAIDIREREEVLREAQERVRQREIEYNAAQKLMKQGYSSDVQVAQAQSALESARATLTRARIDLEKTKITAPFDGVLGERSVDIGDYVQGGDQVTRLVALDPLEVTLYVNEKDVMHISVGDRADIRFAEAEARTGVVSYIAPTADDKTRTFRVDVRMENADYAVPGGLTASVSMIVHEERAHKVSPAILTLNDAGDVGVKIVNDQKKVRFIPVRILTDEPSAMWIAGLPDHVQIITVGQDFVVDGQSVEPVLATE